MAFTNQQIDIEEITRKSYLHKPLSCTEKKIKVKDTVSLNYLAK